MTRQLLAQDSVEKTATTMSTISMRFLKRFNLLALCAATMLIWPISTAVSQPATDVWPVFGHDPQHTGRSAYLGAQSNEHKWEYHLGRVVPVSPAIGPDGTLFIAGNDPDEQGFKVYAFTSDGTVQWAFDASDCEGYCYPSTPAISSDGTIYVAAWNGFLYSINDNGTLQWKARMPVYRGPPVSSPTIASDGTIYIGASDALYAISPGGGIKWKYKTPSAVSSSPAIDLSGNIYFATHFGIPTAYVYAVNPDGTLRWRYDPPEKERTWFKSSPAVDDKGTVYIAEYYSSNNQEGLLAIDQDGALKWKYVIGSGTSSTPAISDDGTIYVAAGGTDDQAVYAIGADGILEWTFQRGGILTVSSSPAIGSDGTIYIGSSDGYLYAITPDGGAIWTQILWHTVHSPVIDLDGTIFVAASYVTENKRVRQKMYAIGEMAESEPN